jgi:hypothetical protein
MVLYNLKHEEKDSRRSPPEKYFISLGNNGASALCIGDKYYYVALTFDNTIAYYEFKGEHGVYFREVCKFQRNLLKSYANAIHASSNEKYIITTGSEADTVVNVWSMNGDKLFSINSYQIQHYFTSCGNKNILIRGWTSEVKLFEAIENKDGSFQALEKGQHLSHDENPLYAAIDNRDMYAISISKHGKAKVWNLYDSVGFNRTF